MTRFRWIDWPRANWDRRVSVGYGLALLVLLAVIGWFYAGVVDTEMLGFIHDDGVYAITGKSLAEGHGFRLLHVPGMPAEIKYPFAYPVILACVWLADPSFPHNLSLMGAVNILFMLAACALCYFYFKRRHGAPGWLSLLIIALFASGFFLMYFVTAVMAEAPYLFFSMLTLFLADRPRGESGGPQLSSKRLALLIALSSLTFLMRAPGLALMLAITLWLMSARQWKYAAIYGLGVLLSGVLPWHWWVRLNAPPVTELSYPLANTYSNYGQEFLHNFSASNYLNGLEQTTSSLLAKLLENMLPVIPNLLDYHRPLALIPGMARCALLLSLFSTYLLAGYYLLQWVAAMVRRLAAFSSGSPAGLTTEMPKREPFSLSGLYLLCYLLLITLWNYEDQMARFLAVVTPLLWLYFFKPIMHLLPDWGKSLPWNKRYPMMAAMAFTMITAVIVLIPAAAPYRSLRTFRTQHWVDSGRYPRLWSDYQRSFAWIKTHVPTRTTLAATSDVVFYLYTGRPTFYVFYSSLRRKHGQFLPQSYPLLMKSLDHYGVRYLVAEPHMQAREIREPVNQVAARLLQTFPERFERIYRSPHGMINIYQVLPEVKSGRVFP